MTASLAHYPENDVISNVLKKLHEVDIKVMKCKLLVKNEIWVTNETT